MLLNDYESNFEKLLHINNDVCNHHRNIQTLFIEYFKTQKGFAPPIMESILKGRNNTYNVRNFQEFETERKRTVYFGLETISYRSPQLWSLLPEHMRQLNSLSSNNGFVIPAHADCVKYIYKMSDFYKSSIKSLTWQGILN